MIKRYGYGTFESYQKLTTSTIDSFCMFIDEDKAIDNGLLECRIASYDELCCIWDNGGELIAFIHFGDLYKK